MAVSNCEYLVRMDQHRLASVVALHLLVSRVRPQPKYTIGIFVLARQKSPHCLAACDWKHEEPGTPVLWLQDSSSY